MKLMNAFAHIVATFAFLTLGSLLVLVAIHLLSMEDAMLRIQELYTDPVLSFKTGLLGFLFIGIGLVFAKTLIKSGQQSDAVIVPSEMGPIVVSALALDDIAKKIIKKFHLVKECRVKTFIHGKKVEMKLKFHLWSGSHVPELLTEIQEQIRLRVRKMIGNETHLDIHCDVQRIEDHELELAEPTDYKSAVSV
ncbi:MAG: hypothetical protein KBC91_05670 [Candidatus Omnitrophica bacterium]|nr:hypothetical protein [Candidatus Omnitrophota bacterium]